MGCLPATCQPAQFFFFLVLEVGASKPWHCHSDTLKLQSFSFIRSGFWDREIPRASRTAEIGLRVREPLAIGRATSFRTICQSFHPSLCNFVGLFLNIFDAMRHRSPVVRTDIVTRNVGFAFIQVLFADFCWFEEAAGVSFSPLKGSKLPDLPGIFWLMVSTLNLGRRNKKDNQPALLVR